jgi:hypothetical protein
MRLRSRYVPCPLCGDRRALKLTSLDDGTTLAHCFACKSPQRELRSALPDLKFAVGTAGARAEPTLLTEFVVNAHGDGTDPIRGAALPRELPEGAAAWQHVNSFRYVDADNMLVGVVDRLHALDATGQRIDKQFRQRVPRLLGGGWEHHLGGKVLPLYRLPELFHRPEGGPVFVCEGEKDVLALLAAMPGHVATTCPGGANGWRPVHTDLLLQVTRDGGAIVLVPDQDAAGQLWARTLRGALGSRRDVREWRRHVPA